MNKCLNCGEPIDPATAYADDFCCDGCAEEYFDGEDEEEEDDE